MTLEHLGRASGDSLLVVTNSLEPTATLDSKSSVHRRHHHTNNNKSYHAYHRLQSSRICIENTVDTNNNQFNIVYFVLYNLIIWTIRAIRSTRIYLLALFYYFVENYLLSYKFLARLLVENKYLSELCNNRPSSRIQMPGHLCVIVNYTDRDDLSPGQIFSLYTRIIDSLLHYDNSRAQIQTISFYKYDNDVAAECKEKILSIYCPKDVNNNSSDAKKSLTIKFLTYSQSGRSMLVNACKSLASQVKSGQTSVEEINVELVDKQIQGKSLLFEWNVNLTLWELFKSLAT